MINYGSTGQIGSSDDFFDTLEETKRFEKIGFNSNKLSIKLSEVIKNEFFELSLDDLMSINVCACTLLCGSCSMIVEEKRDKFFSDTVGMLKEMFRQCKKIPPPKH